MTLLAEVEAGVLAAVRRDRRRFGPGRWFGRRVQVALVAALLGLVPATALAVSYSGVERALRHGAHPVAPVVALPQIGSSRRLSLADYRGQVVILSFYAPWCPPCRTGLPALTQLNRELRATRSGTVMLDVVESPAAAHFRTSIPATQDPKDMLTPFGVTGIPTAFAIDKRGRVTAFAATPQSLHQLRRLAAQASK